MEEIAALEWFDAPPLLGLGRRREAQHVLQHVLEAAAGVGCEPARRDREARAQRVEPCREPGLRVPDEAVVARELPRPARLARKQRALEELRARGNCRRRPVVASDPKAVALAPVDGVLERQQQRVVLDHHPVELGSGDGPAGKRRGCGGEEE